MVQSLWFTSLDDLTAHVAVSPLLTSPQLKFAAKEVGLEAIWVEGGVCGEEERQLNVGLCT